MCVCSLFNQKLHLNFEFWRNLVGTFKFKFNFPSQVYFLHAKIYDFFSHGYSVLSRKRHTSIVIYITRTGTFCHLFNKFLFLTRCDDKFCLEKSTKLKYCFILFEYYKHSSTAFSLAFRNRLRSIQLKV